jgi:hypothetical protein
MEADVRRMLKRANDPLRLAAFPLVQSLCDLTGIPSAKKALGNVIETAFRDVWPETRLRDLLLTADLEGRVFRNQAAQQLQVSTRHLQRRRAKAVSILALHIRKLIGESHARAVDEDRAPADPLETIAELLSDIEPAVAARILRLGGPQSAERANLLAIRASVDAGNETEAAIADARQHAFSPLFATFRAQSKTINGKEGEARQELWPIFTRAARDSTDSAEVAFELEWLAFLRARYHGLVPQVTRVAANLNRLAQDRPAWASRSLLAQAEARVRSGRLQDALALLDRAERDGLRKLALRQLASASVLRAEIGLQRGDDAAAERLAAGAYAILRNRHCDAYRSQATLSRAALRLQKRWVCEDELENLSPTAWDRIFIDIERARHLTVEGAIDRARDWARDSYATASALTYHGLAARAAATIAATFGGKSRQRRHWCGRALSHLLTTRDRSMGCDLFVPDAERNEVGLYPGFDDAISGVLYEALESAIPPLRRSPEAEAAPARIFLRHMSGFVLGLTVSDDRFTRSLETIANDAHAFTQYMAHFLEDAADVLETAFAAIAGARGRSGTDQRLAHALRSFAGAVQPRDDVRRFLVG